jgi:hypothetical protein
MAEKHLQLAILRRFKAMRTPERIAAVRKLAGGSAEDEALVRDFFPAFTDVAQQIEEAASENEKTGSLSRSLSSTKRRCAAAKTELGLALFLRPFVDSARNVRYAFPFAAAHFFVRDHRAPHG